MSNSLARLIACTLPVLLLTVLLTAIQPARAQSTSAVSAVSNDSNYVLLPNPAAGVAGEQSAARVSVELGPAGIRSPSLLESWGDTHWLAELMPNTGGQHVWLSVEKSRFEPESFVYGLTVQLLPIGRGRTAHWDGGRLAWSEFPFRFDVLTANRDEALRIAKSFRSLKGKPRLQTPSGYETNGLHSVTELRGGIRVRSKVTFQKEAGVLTETMLESCTSQAG